MNLVALFYRIDKVLMPAIGIPQLLGFHCLSARREAQFEDCLSNLSKERIMRQIKKFMMDGKIRV
jgi:hypothetical protein